MMRRRMKPLLMILSLAIVFLACGWGWSQLPKTATLFVPTWTNSYKLYGQPHALWLDRFSKVGDNQKLLNRALKAAANAHQIPEFVIYAIPMRDLGQASEGGFGNYADYLADNQLNAEAMQRFASSTGLQPVVYLEPDSLSLAVQYRRDQKDSPEALEIYAQRVKTIHALIALYQQAGAKVYLDGGHSGWFDYGLEDLQRIANALNEAGIAQADGLATNISNRQPIVGLSAKAASEAHYLERLLPLLNRFNHRKLDVRVDTSRNGGPTQARQYYLSPNGLLIDNEHPQGRQVGHWETDAQGEIHFHPYFGKSRTLSRLTQKEKYSYNSQKSILSAPAWLDAVGDVQPGPAPTEHLPLAIARTIQHYRYIKPPDDCDGALNCPPGASKQEINSSTQQKQPDHLTLPDKLWLH
jgi:hypothetical protein